MTRIRHSPPPAVAISMRVAPASIGVLDQFLHDARRPLDDLAGGDLVDHRFGKLADRHGATIGGLVGWRPVACAFGRLPCKREELAPLLA